MKSCVIVLIRAYQCLLAPLLPPSCRYFPSCSQYTVEAIEKDGLLFGILKGLGRLLRCHPLGGSGYNPVE
ncbi:MAG: membrane protein insertion efficiency factor YidD [Candidatus Brocadiales bacterium]|nr:membrane protein insertion efficiency factor YidD [Candidatus Brocadiales bacterium]